jgi:hypothetical protein
LDLLKSASNRAVGEREAEMTQEKACTHCKLVKPVAEFGRHGEGYQSWCKACHKARPLTYTRELLPGYMCWREMNSRCRNPKAKSWPEYGARGIRVYPDWQGRGGYERFIAYIGPRPTPKHQIDRIKNHLGYEPGNVRWVLPVVNMRNRTNTRHLTWNGETKPVGEWAEQFGLNYSTINRRVKKGWTAEEAMFGKKTA